MAIELLDNPLITSLEEDMMGSFGYLWEKGSMRARTPQLPTV